jgi:hypothetical protein
LFDETGALIRELPTMDEPIKVEAQVAGARALRAPSLPMFIGPVATDRSDFFLLRASRKETILGYPTVIDRFNKENWQYKGTIGVPAPVAYSVIFGDDLFAIADTSVVRYRILPTD